VWCAASVLERGCIGYPRDGARTVEGAVSAEAEDHHLSGRVAAMQQLHQRWPVRVWWRSVRVVVQLDAEIVVVLSLRFTHAPRACVA
jgi:hypothetical protein